MNLFYTLVENGEGIDSIHARMLRCSILSVKQSNPQFNIHVLYDGDKDAIADSLRALNVKVYRYTSVLKPLIQFKSSEFSNKFNILGSYFKYDVLKYGVEELGLIDEHILYSNNNTYFKTNISEYLHYIKPKYVATGIRNGFSMESRDPAVPFVPDTGVMLLNLNNMYQQFYFFIKKIQDNFALYEKQNNGDTALLHTFNEKIEVLPSILNWKHQWGLRSSVGILRLTELKATADRVHFVIDHGGDQDIVNWSQSLNNSW